MHADSGRPYQGGRSSAPGGQVRRWQLLYGERLHLMMQYVAGIFAVAQQAEVYQTALVLQLRGLPHRGRQLS